MADQRMRSAALSCDSPLRAQQVNVKDWATGSVLVAVLIYAEELHAAVLIRTSTPAGARCVQPPLLSPSAVH
jgi:hypothetical protein